jgi:Uma2 family endonuclease
MAMPAHTLEWTADMARALPDDGSRYEVLDGELFVTPAPSLRHQFVIGRLFRILSDYADANRAGLVMLSPADIEFSPRRLVQPDLFVAPCTEREPASWRDITRLELAIEVLSPSTARADRHVKRRLYQSQGVPEYWVVDPDARLIERWRPDDTRPELLDGSIVWAPRDDAPPLTIGFESVFGPVERIEPNAQSNLPR